MLWNKHQHFKIVFPQFIGCNGIYWEYVSWKEFRSWQGCTISIPGGRLSLSFTSSSYENFVRRSPCARHTRSARSLQLWPERLAKGSKTMAPVALEGGSVSELNTGGKIAFDGQSHLLCQCLSSRSGWSVESEMTMTLWSMTSRYIHPTWGGEMKPFSGRPQCKAGAGGREGRDQGNQRLVQQRGSNRSLQGESPRSSWSWDKGLVLGRFQKVFFMWRIKCYHSLVFMSEI